LTEQDDEAGELDKAEKVLGVQFPADEYEALRRHHANAR